MAEHPDSLLLRDAPRRLGFVVAVGSVAATTLVIYPLGSVAPKVALGVVYLLAVLLVSTYWGLWLGLFTAVLSAAALNLFHIEPTGRFHIDESENWVALAVFLAAAAVVSTLAGVARARTEEARRRQQEADLAADMARTLLAGESLDAALAAAARRLASALDLPHAALHTGLVTPAPGQTAVSLDLGPSGTGTLLVPADLDEATWERLTARVAPPLEALVAAALDRRSDELKTALLRAVSHDLRSPLTAIIATAEAVASPTLEPGERLELAGVISGEARRLAHLVDQLLDLSRLQAGAAAPRRDWCSVEEILASAVEHVDAPVRVDVEVDAAVPFIEADAAQLERAFVNLLENAARFSGGRPVQVSAEAVDGRVTVRVVDHGPGISAEDLPHVFEPFRRGAETNGHAGSGLGLAIVKGLVEANGGRVDVSSRPGAGAEFRVEFA